VIDSRSATSFAVSNLTSASLGCCGLRPSPPLSDRAMTPDRTEAEAIAVAPSAHAPRIDQETTRGAILMKAEWHRRYFELEDFVDSERRLPQSTLNGRRPLRVLCCTGPPGRQTCTAGFDVSGGARKSSASGSGSCTTRCTRASGSPAKWTGSDDSLSTCSSSRSEVQRRGHGPLNGQSGVWRTGWRASGDFSATGVCPLAVPRSCAQH
jgi:hypothetical protein